MPVAEARELTAVLHKQLGLRVSRLIVNQVFPDRFPHGSPGEQVLERLEGTTGDLGALAGHGLSALRRRQLNERYLAELARHLAIPRLELPFLFAPRLGPDEVDHLSRLVESAPGPNGPRANAVPDQTG
jgi:hypothetical protein